MATLTALAFASFTVGGRAALADDDAPAKTSPPVDAPPPQQQAPVYPQQQGYPQQQQGYPQQQQQQQQGYPQQQQGYPQQAYPPGYPSYRPAPVRMKTVEKPRMGLVIAGACVLGGLWSITAVSGYVAGNYGYIVPVIGPLFYWNGRDGSGPRAENAGLLLLTLAQAAGAGMLIGGLVAKQKVQVPDTSLTVVPTVFPGGGGLTAAGRF